MHHCAFEDSRATEQQIQHRAYSADQTVQGRRVEKLVFGGLLQQGVAQREELQEGGEFDEREVDSGVAEAQAHQRH